MSNIAINLYSSTIRIGSAQYGIEEAERTHHDLGELIALGRRLQGGGKKLGVNVITDSPDNHFEVSDTDVDVPQRCGVVMYEAD